jgi:hypothetical protein
MLHGVLNNPGMAEHAFFYLRDPAFIDCLPPEQQPDFGEFPLSGQIEQLGIDVSTAHAQERRRRLGALKDRIRLSGFPVRENYPNPQVLGLWS